MAIFWDEVYSVGIEEIDEQHKVLIHLINNLEELYHHSHKFKNFDGILLGLMVELKNYTVLHFATEEVLMKMFNYPDFAEHKHGHDSFIKLVGEQYKALKVLLQQKQATENEQELRVINGDIMSRVEKILKFLQRWLVGHIQTSDQEYTDFFLKIQKKSQSLGGWFSFLKS